MSIKSSELILNEDGSIYHLNLKPEHIADTIILVGDQDRVEKVTKHFDSIEFSTQKREFKTQTGYYKKKKISVISTGIGPDNIDIVLNELDALVNINFETQTLKKTLSQLNLIRIGTSGALHKKTPIDSFLLSTHGLDINGMLHFYDISTINNPEIENAFILHTHWDKNKSRPIIVSCNSHLASYFEDKKVKKGITGTAGGFYGPQGRVLRLPLQDNDLNAKLISFNHKGNTIANFEMETAAIYGLSKLLGHKAVSLNAILANRTTGKFSKNPYQIIDNLILFALERIKDI